MESYSKRLVTLSFQKSILVIGNNAEDACVATFSIDAQELTYFLNSQSSLPCEVYEELTHLCIGNLLQQTKMKTPISPPLMGEHRKWKQLLPKSVGNELPLKTPKKEVGKLFEDLKIVLTPGDDLKCALCPYNGILKGHYKLKHLTELISV